MTEEIVKIDTSFAISKEGLEVTRVMYEFRDVEKWKAEIDERGEE